MLTPEMEFLLEKKGVVFVDHLLNIVKKFKNLEKQII